MSLSSKILCILSSVVAVYALIDNVLQRQVVSKGFVAVEVAGAQEDLERVERALDREIDGLSARCRALASWDLIYGFLGGNEELGADLVLSDQLFADGSMDVAILCDSEGSVLWGDIRDPATRKSVEIDQISTEKIFPQHPLLMMKDQEEERRGIYVTDRGPLLSSAVRVRGSSPDFPPRGFLLVGRLLDDTWREALRQQTQVDFRLWSFDDPELIAEADGLIDRVTASSQPITEPKDDQTLQAFKSIADVQKRPALVLRANVDREVTRNGFRSVNYALMSTLATGLLLLLVLVRVLNKAVLMPIAELTDHAVRIGKTDDTTSRIGIDRGDEIGVLSREFDSMMEKIEHSRAALAKTSRLAGRSEIATGVLHNVGNVLNSVNVSATLATKQAEKLSIADLGAVYSALDEHREALDEYVTQDKRGKLILPFLRKLSESLQSQQENLVSEMTSLHEGLEHIVELVRSQQSYAGAAGAFEYAKLEDEVDAALKISLQATGLDQGVEIVRRYDETPSIPVDKQRVMEIVVNLIQNAQQAMESAGVERPRLTLRTGIQGESLFIEVRDNGVGIPPENLGKVFQHGFTTKKNGHGFGLHSAANAAVEMGGRLRVESQGSGQGAAFVLEIPLGDGERAHVELEKPADSAVAA